MSFVGNVFPGVRLKTIHLKKLRLSKLHLSQRAPQHKQTRLPFCSLNKPCFCSVNLRECCNKHFALCSLSKSPCRNVSQRDTQADASPTRVPSSQLRQVQMKTQKMECYCRVRPQEVPFQTGLQATDETSS